MVIFLLLLIGFGIYKLFIKKKSNMAQHSSVSEGKLQPDLKDIEIQKEEKIRRMWLISLLTYIVILMAFSIANSLPSAMVSENKENASIFIYHLITSILYPILWFWITYHCSYTKRGTAWLMWIMISTSISLLITVFTTYWNQTVEWDSLSRMITICVFGFDIFFWINCLRLYKVNSAREYQKVRALKAKYGPEASGF